MSDFWTILFIALSSQGLFLGFILLTRKNIDLAGRFYLTAFVTLFSVVLLFWTGYWNGFPVKYPHFNYIYDPLPFLLGPILFLYLKSRFELASKMDLFHLLPFMIILLWYVPFYVLTENEKYLFVNDYPYNGYQHLWKGSYITRIIYWLHSFSFVAYSGTIYWYLRKKLYNSDTGLNKKAAQMMRLIMTLFTSFSILFVSNYFLREFYSVMTFIKFSNSVLISVFFYAIGYLGLSNPHLESVLKNSERTKYSRSTLDNSKAEMLMTKIVSFIESNKPYFQEDYKLSDLSSDLKIPSHHISELLNKYHNKSYSELINSYRIEEAKKLLISEAYNNKTVSAIGYDVGFNSRTTFYKWFKKITGLSPAAYQQKLK